MINVALFGFGRIGQMHAANLNKNKEIKLLYVYEKIEQLNNKAKKLYKCKIEKDYNKSLITENVEHYKKLIPMLNSKDVETIKQACELGETLGYFKVYDVREHQKGIEWSLLVPYEELQTFLDTCKELGIDTTDRFFISERSGIVYRHPFVNILVPKQDPRFARYRVK